MAARFPYLSVASGRGDAALMLEYDKRHRFVGLTIFKPDIQTRRKTKKR